MGGRSSSSSNDNSPTTTNRDGRNAVQDGVGVSGDGNTVSSTSSWSSSYSDRSSRYFVDNSNSTDAVRAIASAGADVINRAGGAVVDLNKDSIAANSANFDAVVDLGASAIDRLIDASVETTRVGNALAGEAVSAFKPVEGANADVVKYGLVAAAAVAAAVILNKGSQ